MADVPSIVVIENLSWSSSVNRLLLVLTCFGEFGSTSGGTADVLDGIKTLSRGEFNRRKHILAYGGCARGTNGGQNCTVLTSSNFIVD